MLCVLVPFLNEGLVSILCDGVGGFLQVLYCINFCIREPPIAKVHLQFFNALKLFDCTYLVIKYNFHFP